MATSVDNRQFNHLEPPFTIFSSPPPQTTTQTFKDSSDSDSDSDPDHHEWKPLLPNLNKELEPSIPDPRDVGTSDSWIERNPSLIRLTGKHPFNSEPPLDRLMHHGFLTPSPLHYVRNHGPVPRSSWSTWTIQVSGPALRRPALLSMDDLTSLFPPRELPVTLVCAGNRRKEQNLTKQTVGFNWGPAGISTAVWRGARLRDVLRFCGVRGRARAGWHVCFDGAEDLPGGGGSKYATSIPIEMAMDPARDIIVAYMMNGEVLPPDHGFPVRMIIPGFIGGRMVKWVRKITVTSEESNNHYHFKDNRVLPSHVDAELANAEGWWYRPEYIINELNTNSVITTPGHGEILPINSVTSQRGYTMKGYAYSGGGKKVTRVEVTLDGGENWLVCDLDHPEKPNKYGKYWCWCFWSLELEVLDLLGAKEIAVRAWDQTHNTQPEKLIWNVMGMMNNCWFRVKVNVCRPHRGELGLLFDHPTQPGNQSGGWMARQRHLDSAESNLTLKKSISSPFMNTASKRFSMSDVRRHGSSAESPWIVVHGHVYDCTPFVKDHPGGADSIAINAGTDCTEEFDAIHSDRAKSLLENYRIGELIPTGYASSPNNSVHGADTHLAPIKETTSASVALKPREKVPVTLVDKRVISHDVRLFRFALPSEDQVLGLPVGKHIFLCADIDGKLCMRAYTPTSHVDAVGHLDLLVKVYFKGVHPKFPDGGLMSQHLDSLPIGSTLAVKGPVGHIEYLGHGEFLVKGEERIKARRLAMIAGGSGITPVYQVMQAVMRDPLDETEMHLVYANRTEDDILLREELDGWAVEYPGRVKVWYVVNEAKEGWKYGVGFLTEEILRERIPLGGGDDTLALVCGPPPMIQFAVLPNLEKLNYDTKKYCLLF
ncbi:Nitrate reductase [NADH] 1 [Acorus gramineus]|uniref:Nitrate reductase n=1 Tax=Acorus gramineus TaxID=55184 RepID=A0AAV9AIS4_ACOGR|nr:Nitrate reductase [NADH] 1 [Acorus gramineus]